MICYNVVLPKFCRIKTVGIKLLVSIIVIYLLYGNTQHEILHIPEPDSVQNILHCAKTHFCAIAMQIERT